MASITTLEQLREEIRNLEHQDYVNQQHMRHRVSEIADRLKPRNIVKNLVGQLVGGATDAKGNLFKLVAGLATSFVVKKFFKKGIEVKKN